MSHFCLDPSTPSSTTHPPQMEALSRAGHLFRPFTCTSQECGTHPQFCHRLVSPQFHVRFDTEFTTAPDLKSKSSWQYIAGFIRGGKKPNRDSRQKRRNQITPELPLHQKPQSVPNSVQPRQEGEEVNINKIPLPPPYQGLTTTSQIL